MRLRMGVRVRAGRVDEGRRVVRRGGRAGDAEVRCRQRRSSSELMTSRIDDLPSKAVCKPSFVSPSVRTPSERERRKKRTCSIFVLALFFATFPNPVIDLISFSLICALVSSSFGIGLDSTSYGSSGRFSLPASLRGGADTETHSSGVEGWAEEGGRPADREEAGIENDADLRGSGGGWSTAEGGGPSSGGVVDRASTTGELNTAGDESRCCNLSSAKGTWSSFPPAGSKAYSRRESLDSLVDDGMTSGDGVGRMDEGVDALDAFSELTPPCLEAGLPENGSGVRVVVEMGSRGTVGRAETVASDRVDNLVVNDGRLSPLPSSTSGSSSSASRRLWPGEGSALNSTT